jgi:hypothetical protein
MSAHRESQSPEREASIELDHSSKAAFFRTLAGHYDALTAHFPEAQILTPKTPKKFQTYFYQRKVLVRIDPTASSSPPAKGETVTGSW